MTPILFAIALHVSAAVSLVDAMQQVARACQCGEIIFNFGGSGTLARQIEEGAPVDVFVSADEQTMDRLQRGRLIDAKTRRTILSNALVVVVPRDSRLRIASPADLIGVRRIALAEPQSVPAGIYARAYLMRKHLWARVAPKVIPMENVRAALAVVESGNADAGIVYQTDARIAPDLRIAYEVPVADAPKIAYAAAVVRDSRDKAAAQRFVDFLHSAAARDIFLRNGFRLP